METIPLIKGSYLNIMIGLQKASMGALHLPSNNPVLHECALLDRRMATGRNALLAPIATADFHTLQNNTDILLAAQADSKNASLAQIAKNILTIKPDEGFSLQERIDKIKKREEELQAENKALRKIMLETLPHFQQNVAKLLSGLQPNDSLSTAAHQLTAIKQSTQALLSRIKAYRENRAQFQTELTALNTEMINVMNARGFSGALARTASKTKEPGSTRRPE